MVKNLQITFINEGGKKVSMTINDPRKGLTPENVKTAMNSIIQENVFKSKAGNLVAISGARIIERGVTELEMDL